MNSSTNNNTNTAFSPYLLSRFHQHLNHLNDMAFTHTKILQEIIEKRSNEPIISSPHGSISSSPSSSSSTMDSTHQQRKRSYPSHDNHDIKNENHLNKRSRKQSKPQQLLQIETKNPHEQSSSSEDEEEEMGEITEPIEKRTPLPMPPTTIFPFPPTNLPFLNYIQDLARANHITSPTSMGQFLENLAIESRRIPSFFPQTVQHHHPYFSPMLFNNSFINQFSSSSSLTRFPPPSSTDLKDHPNFPFRFSVPKKRRTKVTDTRLSPRIGSKLPPDDFSDDENSSSDGNLSKSDHQSIEYNGFQISDFLNNHHICMDFLCFCFMYVAGLTPLHLRKAKLMFFYTRYPSSAVLKIYFPDVRFDKLITAQLVKWFSNFREFFYQQIEKYARQCLAEGIRNPDDLIVTPNSELYRALNVHYNRSNQINVPISFITAVQSALKEFFLAIQQQKDSESSWKKSIYKIMQRLDDQLPDFFKTDHWMHGI